MPEPNLENELRRILTESSQHDVSSVDLDADFVADLGLDSLAALRLLAAVEKHFQIRFPDHQLGEFRTLGQLLDFLTDRPGGRA